MTQIISDQQLVEYIMHLLPAQQYAALTQQLVTDEQLQQRLTQWEHLLFQLNEQTEAVTPPPAVWAGIEQRLFPEKSQKKEKKRGLGYFLIPAFLSLAILFVGNFYFSHQAAYHAQMVSIDNQKTIWAITGDTQSITFTSLQNVAVDNMDCQAWVLKPNAAALRLGAIPDTGNNAVKRVSLPEDFSVEAGDMVIVVMTKKNYAKALPPEGVPIMNSVILTTI